MKSEEKISMDYNRTIKMADELIELAFKFRNLTKEEAMSQLNTLGSNWKGENAEHFVRKAAGYLQMASESADQLEDLARAIKTNAQNVYNAEMHALRLAQQRSY
jgi:uncharacterized protein YukE